MLILGLTEVLWFRKKKKDEARIEMDDCPNDEFSHNISSLDASFELIAFGEEVFEIVNSSETMNVPLVQLSWNLTALNQAPGAMLTFNIFFFTQNETIIFEGQMVDVFNGTVKTSYEVNFDFSIILINYATSSVRGVPWNIPCVTCIFSVYTRAVN